MLSKTQIKAKNIASKYGYKIRKISEGRVKVTRLDGSQVIMHDFFTAIEIMLQEVYGISDKNIFDR